MRGYWGRLPKLVLMARHRQGGRQSGNIDVFHKRVISVFELLACL